MDATSVCPSCGRQLRLPVNLEGQQVRCPDCSTVFTARRETPADRPPAPEAIQRSVPAATSRPGDFRFQDEPDSLPTLRDEPFDFEARREPMPEQLPGGGVTIAVMVLLAANILVDLGSMAFEAFLLQQPQQVAGLFNLVGCFQPFVYLPTVVVFCVWMYRSYKNLSLFGIRNLSYSPGWAAGAFFVPILNLYRPCQIAQEMWRASNPDIPEGAPWRSTSGSGLIAGWWTFWILTNLVANVNFRLALNERADPHALSVGTIIGDSLSIVAAVFAILVVKQLRSRQEQKFQLLLRY